MRVFQTEQPSRDKRMDFKQHRLDFQGIRVRPCLTTIPHETRDGGFKQ